MPPQGPGEAAAPAPPRPLFGGCWSCRLLSGAGLLLAALWIYRGPRSSMKRGLPPSMGDIAQITFAIGVGAWGVVILVDPVGKQLRKEPRGGEGRGGRGRDSPPPPHPPPPHPPPDPPPAGGG